MGVDMKYLLAGRSMSDGVPEGQVLIMEIFFLFEMLTVKLRRLK